MRCFLSLNFDNTDLIKIAKIQSDFKESLGRESYNIKWEKPENFHITLFFLGEAEQDFLNRIIPKLNELKQSITEKINISIEKLSAFPNIHRPRVLVLKMLPDKNIFQLSSKINSILEEENIHPDKKFSPHLTLGRVKTGNIISIKEEACKTDKINFEFGEFFLMKSTLTPRGAVYEVLKNFNLQV